MVNQHDLGETKADKILWLIIVAILVFAYMSVPLWLLNVIPSTST